VTTGLLAFVTSWNEYLFALNFTITNPAAQTVPVPIAQFSGIESLQEPIAKIMAAAMVVTTPWWCWS
jgi:trehalose/maltose transport system permease protein